MGVVYQASQLGLNRLVAVKMLIAGAYAGAHERARFQREAEAVASRRLDQYGDGMPARADEELGLHLHNWLEAHALRREAEAAIQSAISPGDQAARQDVAPRK